MTFPWLAFYLGLILGVPVGWFILGMLIMAKRNWDRGDGQ